LISHIQVHIQTPLLQSPPNQQTTAKVYRHLVWLQYWNQLWLCIPLSMALWYFCYVALLHM